MAFHIDAKATENARTLLVPHIVKSNEKQLTVRVATFRREKIDSRMGLVESERDRSNFEFDKVFGIKSAARRFVLVLSSTEAVLNPLKL